MKELCAKFQVQRNLISFERSRKFFPETTHPRREGRSRQGVETAVVGKVERVQW